MHPKTLGVYLYIAGGGRRKGGNSGGSGPPYGALAFLEV